MIYELDVRSFRDAHGDGVGDFQGLTEKLDYLQDLGVTALYLHPFYPSPRRNDGYDIADYLDIDPQYGTLTDFQAFLREAHRRDLRVMAELVLGHTSDHHSWFQQARRAEPGSSPRDFYVWSDSPDRYVTAQRDVSDFGSSGWCWDPVAQSYYWHRFLPQQPNLNYDNPEVRKAALRVVDFWFENGVDGLGLYGVPFLCGVDGPTCENPRQTHEFLGMLRAHIDRAFGDRAIMAEADLHPEEASAYFGDGDECHVASGFPLLPRFVEALQKQDRAPIVRLFQEAPRIPKTCRWALRMCSRARRSAMAPIDEPRDPWTPSGTADFDAQPSQGSLRRVAPLLGNNRGWIDLFSSLVFSLPGAPIVYYGDEIGMGDSTYLGGRNRISTPMQWSRDRNAGFSEGDPSRLFLPPVMAPEYHHDVVNVEAQQQRSESLLSSAKRLIAQRKRLRALSRGGTQLLFPEGPGTLAFVRQHEQERVLVVANLSRSVQAVELDLSSFIGRTPVDVFGGARFPPVGASPYFLSLGPSSFYWLALETAATGA